MFCGTYNIPHNISHVEYEYDKHGEILCGILAIPHDNNVMDLNNVMRPITGY